MQLRGEQPKEVYRSEKCEKLKSYLVELQHTCEILKFEMENYEFTIKEQCTETKRRVQLAYEERIKELNKFHEMLIKKVNDYEKKCLENAAKLSINTTQYTRSLIEQATTFIANQNQYLSQVKIDDLEVVSSIKKLADLKAQIEEERLDVKKNVFANGLMQFEPDSVLQTEDTIGSLVTQRIDSTKTVTAFI